MALAHILLTEEIRLLTWVRRYNMNRPWNDYDASITPDTLASPLYYTALMRSSDMVANLLQEGTDVNAQGGFCGNALQLASYIDCEQVVRLLIEKGADVNAESHRGTALQVASFKGHKRIVQILLGKGAGMNTPGPEGIALQQALERGHDEVVQLLRSYGAVDE